MIQAQRFLHRLTLVAVSTIALASASCTSNPDTTEPSQSAEGESTEELQVVTTFLPMTQFTKAVAGDRAEVRQLLPVNADPHDYQAKPTDVQAIAKADVLVKNGLEFEGFLDELVENAENADLVVIDSSEEVVTLATSEEHGEHEHGEHEHGEHEHEEHEHGEHEHGEHEHGEHEHGEHEHGEHEHGEHKGHHHHGEFDPHIWLDPKRAIVQVENIRDGLIDADPDGEEIYRENAAAFIAELQALDEEIAEQLAPYAGQTFITLHDFAFYFAESYGLKAEFLIGVPDENPSPEDMRKISEIVKAENLDALLTEPQSARNTFAALAKDLQVEVSAFDPVEIGDSNTPESYIETMRQNAENLAEALNED